MSRLRIFPCSAWNCAAFSLRYISVGASGVDCNGNEFEKKGRER